VSYGTIDEAELVADPVAIANLEALRQADVKKQVRQDIESFLVRLRSKDGH
jgi:hypothetical protein